MKARQLKQPEWLLFQKINIYVIKSFTFSEHYFSILLCVLYSKSIKYKIKIIIITYYMYLCTFPKEDFALTIAAYVHGTNST